MQAYDLEGGFLPQWLFAIGPAFAAMPLALQYFFAALFGLAIGSFLTVVIHRLPIMMERAWRADIAAEWALEQAHPAPDVPSSATQASSTSALDSAVRHDTTLDERQDAYFGEQTPYNLSLPRSACPNCGHQLTVSENIPLISYLWSKGRCRACAHPIGPLYPLVEALTMLMAVAVLWRFGAGWTAVASFGLCATLIALAFIDARTQLLPDAITLPLLWAGLLLNLGSTFVPLSDAVIGAAAGYLFLWLVYWIFRLVRGKEGMGYGDFKLLAALGAWFGWQALPQLILLSAGAGAVLGLVAMARGRLKRDQTLPFGPYLAIAGVVSLFLGDILLAWLAPALYS
jgi:leader peptidase (prepilin peptidase)/N-methyltransferase